VAEFKLYLSSPLRLIKYVANSMNPLEE